VTSRDERRRESGQLGLNMRRRRRSGELDTYSKGSSSAEREDRKSSVLVSRWKVIRGPKRFDLKRWIWESARVKGDPGKTREEVSSTRKAKSGEEACWRLTVGSDCWI